ncbi:hypothetical protein V6N13_004983 [Hibiscus sabdariffa]
MLFIRGLHDHSPFVVVQVLFDLFRHDMRLWKAYSMTLQSHPSFAEYHDLLDDLEEKLSSPANSEEK